VSSVQPIPTGLGSGCSEPSSQPVVTVLIPVFNDWGAAQILLEQLDTVLAERGLPAEAVFVDDGSTEPPCCPFPRNSPRWIRQVSILELRKNLGHQRALCAGLVHLRQEHGEGVILIMDGDGEDSPSHAPLLLEELFRQGNSKIVFAARGRRTEGFFFRVFYHLYRTVHRVLVGFDIRVGNFSALPAPFLDRLVVAPELWSHYAAAVIKSRLPWTTVPIDRAKRLAGDSRMGFVGLAVHGLAAMSVYGDVVGVRLLVASALLGALTVALIFVAVAVRFATNLAIPGWATYATGLLLLLLFQFILLSLVFTFVILYSRGQSSFVPLRDCPLYVKEVRTVFSRHV
jgi:hypothetical protein